MRYSVPHHHMGFMLDNVNVLSTFKIGYVGLCSLVGLLNAFQITQCVMTL